MRFYEYESKAILSEYGIAVPASEFCKTAEEVRSAVISRRPPRLSFLSCGLSPTKIRRLNLDRIGMVRKIAMFEPADKSSAGFRAAKPSVRRSMFWLH